MVSSALFATFLSGSFVLFEEWFVGSDPCLLLLDCAFGSEGLEQGVVTTMCPVVRSATAIKMKSRDQAHRQATIKGSRRLLDQKSDQNQDDFAIPCILLNTCYKLSTVVHQSRKLATDCFQLYSAL